MLSPPVAPPSNENVAPPTPPPSPPVTSSDSDTPSPSETQLQETQISKLAGQGDSVSSSVTFNNNLNSAKNDSKTSSNGLSKLISDAPLVNGSKSSQAGSGTAPSFTIQAYGEQTLPIKKIQTKVWEPSPRKQVVTTSVKPQSNGGKATLLQDKQKLHTVPTPPAEKELQGKKNSDIVSKPSKTVASSITSAPKSFTVFKSSSKDNSTSTYVAEEQPCPPPLSEVFENSEAKKKETPSKATVRFNNLIILLIIFW